MKARKMDVPLQGPRYTLEHTADGIRAVIWLCGWSVGESTVIAQLLGHPFSGKAQPAGFLGIWLLFWTLGGIAALATLLWQFAGREMIALSSDLDPPSRSLRSRLHAQLSSQRIQDLRASTNAFSSYGRSGRAGMPFGVGGVGSLVFDYGARTIRMAPSLDEAEAKILVKEFSTRLKGKQQ
jgi:hypothetical protein